MRFLQRRLSDELPTSLDCVSLADCTGEGETVVDMWKDINSPEVYAQIKQVALLPIYKLIV